MPVASNAPGSTRLRTTRGCVWGREECRLEPGRDERRPGGSTSIGEQPAAALSSYKTRRWSAAASSNYTGGNSGGTGHPRRPSGSRCRSPDRPTLPRARSPGRRGRKAARREATDARHQDSTERSIWCPRTRWPRASTRTIACAPAGEPCAEHGSWRRPGHCHRSIGRDGAGRFHAICYVAPVERPVHRKVMAYVSKVTASSKRQSQGSIKRGGSARLAVRGWRCRRRRRKVGLAHEKTLFVVSRCVRSASGDCSFHSNRSGVGLSGGSPRANRLA